MPRELTLGNGDLLVNFDRRYYLLDLYWPYVGKENQTDGHPCRFGVWADGDFAWLEDEGWERSLLYEDATLVTRVDLIHRRLGLRLRCADAVDFHNPLLVRRVLVEDLLGRPREVRLFWHHDLRLAGTDLGDTVFFDPKTRSIVHYKDTCYVLIGTVGPKGFGVARYATGRKAFGGAQGTWVDAQDGVLGGNPIEQGAVDSTVGLDLAIPAGGSAIGGSFLLLGHSYSDVAGLVARLSARGIDHCLRRTAAYWRLWVVKERFEYAELPTPVIDLFVRSQLIVRTQIDNRGAILAANDHDITAYARDTYSYVWPRDGALVAAALDQAGHFDVTARFYEFCARVISDDGYLLHKYGPDGTTASSWHPWVGPDGSEQLPIQEDETALVLWALWQRFHRKPEVEVVRPLFRSFMHAAEFLASWRDPTTGLPWPSYDLWEERRGVFTFTCGAVVGGLRAAESFARAFAETEMAERYGRAAAEVQHGMEKHLWDPQRRRFLRMLKPTPSGAYEPDPTIDASLYGCWRFGAFSPEDPKVQATMRAVRERLWVSTPTGGLARYEGDRYQAVTDDFEKVPGNPWPVCTLWLAQYAIANARNVEDLREAIPLLSWVENHALASGLLPEQLHPFTGAPLSVSPLTWSHAEVVATVLAWLEKRQSLDICPTCKSPRAGPRPDARSS